MNAAVCPFWTIEEKYNTILQKVARTLNWELLYGIKFNGVHCLRRGAIRYIRDRLGGEAVATSSCNQTTTARFYLPGNDERSGRVGKSFESEEIENTTKKIARKAATNKKSKKSKSSSSPAKKKIEVKKHPKKQSKVQRSLVA